ncbi:MAG: hypothetical protein ACE5JR_06585 [Gemmatimonadota bacterium]
MPRNPLVGLVLSATMVLAACAPAEEQQSTAEEAATTEQGESFSIEGTYRLVSRELPDGTTQEPPDVVGLITYTKNYRNFNIMVSDAEGRRYSVSYIANYALTATEYSETSIYRMVNDEIGGGGLSYDLSGPSGSSPVTTENGLIEVVFPLYQEPTVIFEGDKITATIEGEFTDFWERVE